MAQDKTQFEVNGYTLNKNCNAILGHLRVSLWAKREAIICGVTHLGEDIPSPAIRVLQLMPSRCADSCN